MSEQFEPHAEMSPELVLSEAETRRLVEQIEARIKATEKLERAIATRPQPIAEPVAVWREAWQAAKVNGAWSTNDNGLVLDLSEEAAAAVIASALEAARREDQDRIAALEADNARLMGLVKVLQPYLAVLTEKPQKANWTDRYCAMRDQLEVVASDILAKIKETPDA